MAANIPKGPPYRAILLNNERGEIMRLTLRSRFLPAARREAAQMLGDKVKEPGYTVAMYEPDVDGVPVYLYRLESAKARLWLSDPVPGLPLIWNEGGAMYVPPAVAHSMRVRRLQGLRDQVLGRFAQFARGAVA